MRAWGVLLLSLALLIPAQGWLDAQAKPAVAAGEWLALRSGRALQNFSLGFHGVLADVYWLRAIQYFGDKVQAGAADGDLSRVKEWKLDALAPLLELVTKFAPQHVAAYRFGAAFLPDVAPTEAAAFVERGVRANPDEWRLYLDLGTLHWQRKDFAAARAAYEQGSRVPGAPAWLTGLAATMAVRGGDRATARQLYARLAESSTDPYARALAASRLTALQTLDELDALNAQLATAQARNACPRNDDELQTWLRARDVTDAPFRFDRAQCRLQAAPDSPLARWLAQ